MASVLNISSREKMCFWDLIKLEKMKIICSEHFLLLTLEESENKSFPGQWVHWGGRLLRQSCWGGRGVWGRGGGSGGPQVLQPKRKAERWQEKETWHQDSLERWALETAKRTREGQPPPFFFLLLHQQMYCTNPPPILPDHSYSDNRKICDEAFTR